MSKLFKKIAALMLAVSMTVPAASAMNIVPAATVEAAKSQKLTLYVGEQFSVYGVKSIKSSKKSVVAAGTDKSSGTVRRYMNAKKAGKATVTTKSNYGNYTTKYTVTVKKNPCKASVKWSGYQGFSDKYGDIIITVKNTSKQVFDDCVVKYTFKDASGNVLEQDTKTISYILGKKSAYLTMSVSNRNDIASISAKVVGLSHNPNYSYKDATKNVKVTKSEEAAEKEIKVHVTAKNNAKDNVTGQVYALMYNGSNELIGVKNLSSFYLKKGATETSYEKTLDIAYYPGYDHYKVVSGFYIKKY